MKDHLVFVTLIALSVALGSTIMLISTIQGLDSEQSSSFPSQTAAATYESPARGASTSGMVTLQIKPLDDEQILLTSAD